MLASSSNPIDHFSLGHRVSWVPQVQLVTLGLTAYEGHKDSLVQKYVHLCAHIEYNYLENVTFLVSFPSQDWHGNDEADLAH